MIDEKKTLEYAEKILHIAKNSIMVRFRFFDAALAHFSFEPKSGLNGVEVLGNVVYYDPLILLIRYKDEPGYAFRLLLHILFHSVFLHKFRTDKTETEYWDIATDIAVENIILKLDILEGGLLQDTEEKMVLNRLSKWVPRLTAEAIYREFLVGGISKDSKEQYGKIFAFDRHVLPSEKEREVFEISQKDFERIAERLKAELKSFSKDLNGKESILMNLKESTRKRYDYDAILARFAQMNEEIKVNPDEFDYIFYTYGLNKYHGMPLIEPLEYVEDKKIKEFVIAIDTSASVRGKDVEDFLQKTYDILEKSVVFSDELKVHVLQCDAKITSDTLITSKGQLKALAGNFEVKGFGATDYRPVFAYVEELIKKGELKQLKGLIYFTDGYGIYPAGPPGYDCMFVFNREDDFRVPVPGWAIQVVLETEE